jgi:hypothetical protein
MVARTFQELVQDLSDRRRLSEAPPILLLGAGASMGAGVGMMGKLYEFVGVKDFDGFVSYIVTRDENERYRLLAEFLQTQDPREVTPGYEALAALCAAAVFDVVLTTNLDPLLDDALAAARLRRRDYLTFINGVTRAERLTLLLRSRSPRLKIIKLHGDLFHRFMAWTPPEMEVYMQDVAPALNNVFTGRDVLVVGYSLRDDAVRSFVMGLGGAVWFVNPSPPPQSVMGAKNVRTVVAKELTFESAFTELRSALGLGGEENGKQARSTLSPRKAEVRRVVAERERAESADSVETMDDFASSVVGLATTEEGPAEMTGFLLAEPRLIVTDGWAGNVARFPDGRLFVVMSDGQRRASRIHQSRSQHPFGPAWVDAPETMRVPGLRLARGPLAKGGRLHIAIAAGERVGLTTGTVTTAKEQRLDIQPIGPVANLIHVKATVAPGSSGAPAVDENMRVRGFVVAGSSDPRMPDTFVLPSTLWENSFAPAPRRKRPPAQRKVEKRRR